MADQSIPTASELLDDVKRAIQGVLVSGQEYSNALGRMVKRADLAKLRELRDELKAELRLENGDDGIRIAGFREV